MDFAVPNFETGDKWVRKLNERFLLDTRLWNSHCVSSYAARVQLAVSMLGSIKARIDFIAISQILAIHLMQWENNWLYPISWSDLMELEKGKRKLN